MNQSCHWLEVKGSSKVLVQRGKLKDDDIMSR